METAKRITILLVMLLLTGEAAQPAGKSPDSKAAATPAATQISNTHSASCLVKVTCGEAVLPLNFLTVEYLLHSTGVSGKAARDVLDLPPDAASELFQIGELSSAPDIRMPSYPPQGQAPPAHQEGPGNENIAMENPPPEPKRSMESVPTFGQPSRTGIPRPSTTPEQTILFQLQVDIPEDSPAKPAAVEFMNALINNLRSTLRDASQAHVAKLDSQFKQAILEADAAEAEFVMLQGRIRELAGGRDLSPGAITNQIRDLRQQLERAKMQYASDQGTIQGITERITTAQARIEEQLKNDPVVNELQAITERAAREVADIEARVKQEGPAGPTLSAELQNAREKLTKTRIELARRREELSRSEIISLNNKLADISVSQTQAAAYRANIEQQLAEAEGLLAKADEYELLLLKADLARQNLQQAIIWRDKMKRQAGFLPVADVLVLGGQ